MATELSLEELVQNGRAALFHNKEIERLEHEAHLASNREYWMAAIEEIRETFPPSVRPFIGFSDVKKLESSKSDYLTIHITIPDALLIRQDFRLNKSWNDKTKREEPANWGRNNDFFLCAPILSLSEDGTKSAISAWNTTVAARFHILEEALVFAIDSYQEEHKNALGLALAVRDQQRKHKTATVTHTPTIGERLEEIFSEMIQKRLPRE